METGATEVTQNRTANLEDQMPVMDGHFYPSEGNERVSLFAIKADPANAEIGDHISLPKWLAKDMQTHPLTTVGQLYTQYVRFRSLEAKVRAAMETINDHMNAYADEAQLCSQYDEAVEALNDVIARDVPEWGFRFNARSYQYRCVVRRTRTIVEEAVMYVEGTRQSNRYDLAEMACEQADYADEWEVLDEDIEQSELYDYERSD